MNIGKLLVLLLGMLVFSNAAWSEEATHSWNFRVFLDDKPIGYHRFTLRNHGDQSELQSSARFDVKVLFIKAYHYAHDDTEQWQGDCLHSMTAHTDDNGKSLSVSAKQQAAELNVTSNSKQYTLSGCVMSFAYWNPLMLKQTRLLNAQTGEYDQIKFANLGKTSLSVRGVAQDAQHYRLTGSKLSIDLWYSSSGEWLALESTTEKNRKLRYVLN